MKKDIFYCFDAFLQGRKLTPTRETGKRRREEIEKNKKLREMKTFYLLISLNISKAKILKRR
ncbi:MAG: hypothetical protein JSV88_28090 [Candidatus Aminicenantes bacterium]|nr:MAG: hypothetical protein JSV88_28090 [Candidatus Aminicenantes bacterium]